MNRVVHIESAVSHCSGPDFICIGLQKAGTRWLYQQLRAHPNFWMPPIKELNFFTQNLEKKNNIECVRVQSLRVAERLKGGRPRQNDVKDDKFYQFIKTYRDNYLDFDWYENLLNLKDQQFSGDVSESYSLLSIDAIRKIIVRFPEARIVLLLRDPVSRLWSQLCQHWRNGLISSPKLQNWDTIKDIIVNDAAFTRRMYPSKVWENWSSVVQKDNIGFWFLEDIAESPVGTLRDILEFIGAPYSENAWQNPSLNTKANNKKIALGDALRQHFNSFFLEEIERCARLFGGHAVTWKNNLVD
jgi:hypothetical protein